MFLSSPNQQVSFVGQKALTGFTGSQGRNWVRTYKANGSVPSDTNEEDLMCDAMVIKEMIQVREGMPNSHLTKDEVHDIIYSLCCD